MKKKKKITVADKALANAVKKGEISPSVLPKSQKSKVRNILKSTSDVDLDKASKSKYKHSKRKVVSTKKKKNESVEQDDFKKIITNFEDWDDEISGGLAKDKSPDDFDIDNLSTGAEIQMEHTDDPEKAIDIAMDHLEEHPMYYDDEDGLPAFEKELEELEGSDDLDEDEEYYQKINNIKMENNSFIKRFSRFSKVNENELQEPRRYPKENKFKRVIDFNDDVEQSLVEHNFEKAEGKGSHIVFDIMMKTYNLVNDQPDDIRPCGVEEFDHMMDNL